MYNVALTMIVKDESHIIRECLETVCPYIDYYCISDTGSTDDTKEIIRNFFAEKGIPGEIHDDKWERFDVNRTKAFQHVAGKAKWSLVMDADDKIEGMLPVWDLNPEVDAYVVRLTRESLEWWRSQLFNLRREWSYVGILHEYAHPVDNGPQRLEKLEGKYKWLARTEGNRTRQCTDIREKYRRDYNLLKEEMGRDPWNPRNQFYLAQSAFDAQDYETAEVEYERRAYMGGWHEEVYFSWVRVAECRQHLGKPYTEVVDAFLRAYNASPARAEPLLYAAVATRMAGNHAAASVYAQMAAGIPFPQNEILFVDKNVYDWRILDEVSSTAHRTGKWVVGFHATKALLDGGKCPPELRPRMESNLKAYADAITRVQQAQQAQQAAQKQPAPNPAGKIIVSSTLPKDGVVEMPNLRGPVSTRPKRRK